MKSVTKILFVGGTALLGVIAMVAASTSTPSSVVSATTMTSTNVPSNPGYESVGPFASWSNVKTKYGAVGNGTTDDTAAFNNALADLGQPGHSSCLYVPAGTYKITGTLHIQTRMKVIIQGDDPNTTILKWAGATGGVIFWPDGVTMAEYRRLTFDASSISGVVCVDQRRQGNWFDTNILYEDCIFKDGSVGIRAGANGQDGSAETTVNRCRFYRMTEAGVTTAQFNSLDWWIWDSLFDSCYKGLSNEPGAGDFYAFHCTFKNSTMADVYVLSSGFFTLRDNYSTNSACFLLVPDGSSNGGPFALRNNTVVNCKNDRAIDFNQPGPLVLLDNVFASKPGTTGIVVRVHTTQQPSDTLSVSNIFTTSGAGMVVVNDSNTPRWMNLDQTTVARSSLTPVEPSAAFALNYNRTVIEVSSNAPSSEIQNAINQAATYKGNRPIIHIPEGDHQIGSTITIPANLDVQLVGDGYNTVLRWCGANFGGPLLLCQGPSKATVRDIFFNGNSQNCMALLTVTNANQAGGSVFTEGLRTDQCFWQNVNINMGPNTICEFRDLIHQATLNKGTGTSFRVSSARVRVSGAASSNNYRTWDVSNNGRLCVEAAYYEAGDSRMMLLTGNSTISFMGSKYDNVSPTFQPTIIVSNYNGTAMVGASKLSQNILLQGAGSGQFWSVGNHAYPMANSNALTDYFTDQSSGMVNAHTLDRWSPNSPSYAAPEEEAANATPSYARQMLAHLRSESSATPTDKPDGITDFRAYRLYFDGAFVGLNILGSP